MLMRRQQQSVVDDNTETIEAQLKRLIAANERLQQELGGRLVAEREW